MLEDFQDAIVAYPMIANLDRLLPDGVDSLPRDLADALRDDSLEEALELSESWWNDAGPDSESAGITYGLMLTAFEKDEEALAVLRDARDAILGPTPALRLASAEVHLNLADDETAAELLDEIRDTLDEYPDRARPPLWAATGELYGDLGDEEASLECYRRAIGEGWEDFETAIRVGEMLKRREAWTEAAEAYEHAASLRTDALGPREAAAECWREAGDLEAALEAEQPVIDERGADPDTWAKRGVAWRSVGHLERAIAAFKSAADMNPHDATYWLELANTRLDAGEAEGALKAYEEVLSYEPQFQEALEGATAAAEQLGDYAAAENFASRAVETEDATPHIWFRLGRIRRELGKTDSALDALQRAASDDPDHAETHALLADLHLEAGDDDAGRESLERAMELAPEDPLVRARCAMALLKSQQASKLLEFTNTDSDDSAEWRLISPAFDVIADAMTDRNDLQPLADHVQTLADELSDHLPVNYDTSELRRYLLVLDDPHADLLEAIIRTIEGRDTPDEFAFPA